MITKLSVAAAALLMAATPLTDTLAVDVRYHDTDEHEFGEVYGARGVVSLRAVF